MPYVVAGLLILVALASGGVKFSPNTAQSESGRVLVSGGEAAIVESSPQSSAKKLTTAPAKSIKSTSEVLAVDYRTPIVSTYAAQNINSNSANARAQVDVYGKKGKQVYIVYGYDERRVRSVVSQYKSFSSIPNFTDDKVRVRSIDTRIAPAESYSAKLNSLVGDVTYFYTYCLDYDGGHVCGNIRSFETVESNYRSDIFNKPKISLSRASNIEAYSAYISGTYSINDGRNGIVFLTYGTSKSLIDAVSKETDYSDVDEDGELIKVNRLAAKAIGKGEFGEVVDDLDRDTQYFYRVCIDYESDDEDGIVCSNTSSLTTDRRDMSSKPTSDIEQAVVSATAATLAGSVEMNDFNDGHAFFAYGINENSVVGIEKSKSFNSIPQRGDALQLVSLNTNTDSDKSFTKTVRDLLPRANYYYRLCVEYVERNDYGREMLYLSCSDVRTFTTSN